MAGAFRPGHKGVTMCATLEIQPQRKLDDAGIIDHGADSAEGDLRAGQRYRGVGEIYVVQQIVSLTPERQGFVFSDRKMLHKRSIDVEEAGPPEMCCARGAVSSNDRLREIRNLGVK